LVLAQSYLAGASLPRVAQPYLERLSDRLGESCSVSILHGQDVIYVARSTRKRMASLHRDVGTHLPAWCTSMGRVLLAALPEAELDAWLETATFEKLTPFTAVEPWVLRARLTEVRTQGWCLIDQEMEVDLLSLAVPLRNARGRVVAALNTSTQVSRRSVEVVLAEFLPALLEIASELRPLLV
jgi:IclR family pca regulon transcriptional regulator